MIIHSSIQRTDFQGWHIIYQYVTTNTLIPTLGGLTVKPLSHRQPLKPHSPWQHLVYSRIYCQVNPLWIPPKAFCHEIAQGPRREGLSHTRWHHGNGPRGPACCPLTAQDIRFYWLCCNHQPDSLLAPEDTGGREQPGISILLFAVKLVEAPRNLKPKRINCKERRTTCITRCKYSVFQTQSPWGVVKNLFEVYTFWMKTTVPVRTLSACWDCPSSAQAPIEVNRQEM